jgi:hypothetical protein
VATKSAKKAIAPFPWDQEGKKIKIKIKIKKNEKGLSEHLGRRGLGPLPPKLNATQHVIKEAF